MFDEVEDGVISFADSRGSKFVQPHDSGPMIARPFK